MSPQRDDMITEQVPERYIEDEDNPWTLGSLMRTSKTGSPSASTATNIVIWQRNADQRRKNRKREPVSNVTRKSTSPKITKESRQ